MCILSFIIEIVEFVARHKSTANCGSGILINRPPCENKRSLLSSEVHAVRHTCALVSFFVKTFSCQTVGSKCILVDYMINNDLLSEIQTGNGLLSGNVPKCKLKTSVPGEQR